MDRIKVGFLPLYLALYDQTDPQVRPIIDSFSQKVCCHLRDLDLDVTAVPVCRISEEFENAVDLFVEADVCAVITLHLAYSPSLECIDALSRLNVPIIIMDTTPDYSFDQNTHIDAIMYNHGIHGVQDMCSLLKRRNKTYFVEAGHIDHSDILERIHGLCKSAYAAIRFKTARVGLVGRPFVGMGDFQVSEQVLAAQIGMKVVPYSILDTQKHEGYITQDAIEQGMLVDMASYSITQTNDYLHRQSVKAGLLIRKWIEDEKLTALSVNFLDMDEKTGLDAMPVLEIDKGMSMGIGYAGEGDVLTAGLYGALYAINSQITFTEMFCPDWKGQTIFLSHMAEVNPSILADKPTMEYLPFPYTKTCDPAVLYGCYQPGTAVLVNLAPVSDTKFRLILIRGKINETGTPDALKKSVHGWFSPECRVEDLLKTYSEVGGTHHLVLLYGAVLEHLIHFGQMMSFEIHII